MKKSTVKPLRTSTVRESVTLESKKADVIHIRDYAKGPANMDWLMTASCSTPYATSYE